MTENFMKSKEVMEWFRISRSCLAAWIRDDKFPSPFLKIGKERYWKKEQIIRFIEENRMDK